MNVVVVALLFCIAQCVTVAGFVFMAVRYGELLHARTPAELIAVRSMKRKKEPEPESDWVQVGVTNGA